MRLLRWALYMTLLCAGGFGGLMLVLKLTSGTSAVTVPPVCGFKEDQARFQAERAGLVYQVASERYDLKVAVGRVVSQTPEAGFPARKGQTLRVVVSKGVDTVTVPDWLGAGATQAQIHAKQVGLKVASLAYLRSARPAQTVIAQTPLPGTLVPRESEVSLLLSSGPPSYTFLMPELQGMPVERARALLQSYGVESAPPRSSPGGGTPGMVVVQSPLPGYPLDRSQIVQLAVSAP